MFVRFHALLLFVLIEAAQLVHSVNITGKAAAPRIFGIYDTCAAAFEGTPDWLERRISKADKGPRVVGLYRGKGTHVCSAKCMPSSRMIVCAETRGSEDSPILYVLQLGDVALYNSSSLKVTGLHQALINFIHL